MSKAREACKRVAELSEKATTGSWLGVMINTEQISIIANRPTPVAIARIKNDVSQLPLTVEDWSNSDFIASSRDLMPKLAECLSIMLNHCEACGCGDLEDCSFCIAVDEVEQQFEGP